MTRDHGIAACQHAPLNGYTSAAILAFVATPMLLTTTCRNVPERLGSHVAELICRLGISRKTAFGLARSALSGQAARPVRARQTAANATILIMAARESLLKLDLRILL